MVKLTEHFVLARTRAPTVGHVRKLNCWGSDLTDISILRKLSGIQVVSLSVNQINTLSDLSQCHNLEELYIRKNCIGNLAEICHLKGLSKLRVLWLADNPCALGDRYRLTVLKTLPHLTKLDNVTVDEEELTDAADKGADLELPGEEVTREKQDKQIDMEVDNAGSADKGECIITPRPLPPPPLSATQGNKASDNNNSSPGNHSSSLGNSGSSPGNSGSSPANHGSSLGNSGTSPANHGSSLGNSGSSRGNHSSSLGNSGSSLSNHGSLPGDRGDGAAGEDTLLEREACELSPDEADMSLAWEETNKLRMQFGLKPLSEEKAKPARNFTKQLSATTRNANVLQAVLCLVKELDSHSLHVVKEAVDNELGNLT